MQAHLSGQALFRSPALLPCRKRHQSRSRRYLKGDVNYHQIAERVFPLTDARKYMKEQGMSTPDTGYKKFKVMGKGFDASKAEEYVNSFAIKKLV
jgi:hypothetical protein